MLVPQGIRTPGVLLADSAADATTWTNLVDQSPTPDVYFRPGYAAAYSGDHATAFALVIHTSRRRYLLPLLMRQIHVEPAFARARDYDVITPYGYGGVLPLERGMVTSEEAAELLQQLTSWAMSANVVSCMFRLHPLLGQHSVFSAAVRRDHGEAVAHSGPTVAIDLLAWDDRIHGPAGMRKGRRSDLSHARRHLTVKLVTGDGPQIEPMLDQFRSLYEPTMSRLNARRFYLFPCDYYASLRHSLQDRVAVAIAYLGEQPVSAALFFADKQFGHYHLSGVTHEGRQHKAQTMVLVEGAQWLRRRGCRWFHLGGGRAPGDSLYRFKHSFGARTLQYSALTLIANKARYDELVNLTRVSEELAGPARDFFPAYRAAECK